MNEKNNPRPITPCKNTILLLVCIYFPLFTKLGVYCQFQQYKLILIETMFTIEITLRDPKGYVLLSLWFSIRLLFFCCDGTKIILRDAVAFKNRSRFLQVRFFIFYWYFHEKCSGCII